MENSLRYAPADALADARAAKVSAARRLAQPWWLHLLRGALVAGICLAKVIPGAGWIRLGTVAALAAAFLVLETWMERRRGLQATPTDVLRSYPGRQWSMLLLFAVGVVATEYIVARGLPLLVQATPAVIILLAWTWFGIHADQQRLARAQAGMDTPAAHQSTR